MLIDEKIRMAFKLWEKMAQCEQLLWDCYYKEFLQLCIEQETKENNDLDLSEIQF